MFVHFAEFLFRHDVDSTRVQGFIEYPQNQIVQRDPIQNSQHLRHVAELPPDGLNLVLEDGEDLRFLRSFDHEVVDLGIVPLTVSMDPADALLQTVRVPGQLIVDERMAIALEIQAFRSSISGEQQARVGVVEAAFRVQLRAFLVFVFTQGHAAVNYDNALR